MTSQRNSHGLDRITFRFLMLRSFTPADEYLETQVKTASPERLHLMVVDAALRYGQQGVDALERGEIEAAWLSLNRSRACVAELISGIKPEPDPELSANLRGVFVFAYRQLATAGRTHAPQPAVDALKILQIHRETWQELIQQLQSGRTPNDSLLPKPHSAPKNAQASTAKLFRSV